MNNILSHSPTDFGIKYNFIMLLKERSDGNPKEGGEWCEYVQIIAISQTGAKRNKQCL